MRKLDFSLRELSQLGAALYHYQQLAHYFTQLSTTQRESLNKFWTENIIKRVTDSYLKPDELSMWNDVDIHIIKQTWGNTSGGWEGIGGQAITSSYTTVIENLNYGFACIFYGETLAYICNMNEAYWKIHRASPPGMSTCRKVLDVIYKHEYK